MTANAPQPDTRPILAVVNPPAEMIESENLVIRQANALVISSDEDYAAAGRFLNEVVVAGRKQVHELFDVHVRNADHAHKSLTAARAKHLEPWATAEQIIKAHRVKYYRDAEDKRLAEQRERERAAREIEENRKRQEAQAERERVAVEAERLRKEADEKRVAAEAEAERLRNIAAAEETSDLQRRAAEKQAKELEEQSARDTKAAEETAVAIAASGEATAQAIEQEPVILDLPSPASARLTGVAEAWGVDKENWNPVEFAKWIAVDPVNRAKYIGAPAWTLLTAEAKQQKRLFNVGGITAGKKFSGRAGGR